MNDEYKEKIEIAQFFRIMDEFFLGEEHNKKLQREYKNKKERKINKDKVIFIVGIDFELADKIRKVCKSTRQQPSFLIKTIIKDYFNAALIK
jgi:basic membrane lipoprotein Med (substrate-binding protein (PBP1-ABC) superfamily)